MIYLSGMSHLSLQLDEAACAIVMERYNLPTKQEAVNFALNVVAAQPMTVEEARTLRGSGWTGDLEELRANRIFS